MLPALLRIILYRSVMFYQLNNLIKYLPKLHGIRYVMQPYYSARQETNVGVVLKERPEHVPGIQADKVIDTAPRGFSCLH